MSGHQKQVAPLSIEEPTDDETTNSKAKDRLPITVEAKDKPSKPNQSTERSTKHQHADGSIKILGDSMLRPLNPSKLCRSTGKSYC